MKGFQPGDPRAVAAARRGGARSAERRRQQMFERFKALANVQTTPFEAFLLGWEAHRVWSSRRRHQLRQAPAEPQGALPV